MDNGIRNKKPAAGTAGQGGATTGTVRHIYYNRQGRPVATLEGHILRKRVRASLPPVTPSTRLGG